jgi:hypothetical protein
VGSESLEKHSAKPGAARFFTQNHYFSLACGVCSVDSKGRMRILVVIPTRGDRAQWLAEALASVEAQTRQADEVCVAGSVEERDISFSLRVNRAIELSTCDAFILLSDDDLLTRTYIERTASVMEQAKVDIVWTDVQEFGGRAWGDATGYSRRVSAPVTALCRKSTWKDAGGLQDVPYFDWDFWWSCRDRGATDVGIHEPLFLYRVHPEQVARHANEDHFKSVEFVRSRHTSRFP